MKSRSTSHFALAALIMLGLASCSSGGAGFTTKSVTDGVTDGPGEPAEPKIDKPQRDALHSELMALESRFYMFKPQEGHAVRNHGTATFNGIAGIGTRGTSTNSRGHVVSNMPEIIADMALNIDFVTDEISASLWDFHALSGEKADGSVQMSGTEDKGKLAATGTGTLYWSDGEQELDMTLDGWLLANEDGAKGNFEVFSTIDDETTEMDGIFILLNDKKSKP